LGQKGMKLSCIPPCVGLLILGHLIQLSDAVVAKPGFFSAVQPNEEVLKLQLKGDENANWIEDEEGNVVVHTSEGFQYSEGLGKDGKLVPSGIAVGKQGLKTLKHIKDNGRKRNGRSTLTEDAGSKGEGRGGARPRGTEAQRRRRDHLGPGGRADLRGMPEERRQAARGRGNGRRRLTSATLKNLVVPILFSDHTDRALPSQSELDTLWNEPGGPPSWQAYANQSVKEFYHKQSYGNLVLESTVLDWIEIDSTEAECANGDSGTGNEWMDCLRDVLTTADASVDFNDFDEDGDGYIDAIAFMHSGYGAEYGGWDVYGAYYTDRIWSHKWAIFDADAYAWDPFNSSEGVLVYDYHVETALNGLSGGNVTSIGVCAHETGHFLGLPDLYDTDYSSSGIDAWGIMANSWGWDGTGGNPPSFSAPMKAYLGWLDPVELDAALQAVSASGGWFNLSAVQTDGAAYVLNRTYPEGEYLLIENRQARGADRDAPQGGLLVWHVDEALADVANQYEGYPGQSSWPENGYHYFVALLQADGLFDLEMGYGGDSGDPFHGGPGGNAVLNSDPEAHPSSFAYKYGELQETGFKLMNVSSSSDNMMFYAFFGNASGFNATEGPGIALEMYDSWGDGWHGTEFGIWQMGNESGMALSYYTLIDGDYEKVNVPVANDTCYAFRNEFPLGDWTSEISWSICDVDGEYDDTAYFCIDEVGGCSEYTFDDCTLVLKKFDSWGDGWNDNWFTLYDEDNNGEAIQDVTLHGGFSGKECLNVQSGKCYSFSLSVEAFWGSEISWKFAGGTKTYDVDDDVSFCLDDDGSLTTDEASTDETSTDEEDDNDSGALKAKSVAVIARVVSFIAIVFAALV